jgi:hypothetical protein
MYSLLLPAGQAKQEGLVPGRRVEGLRPIPLRIEADKLALWVLEGGTGGLRTAWRYFKENPGAFGDFDIMAGLVESRLAEARASGPEEKAAAYAEAKAQLYVTVL